MIQAQKLIKNYNSTPDKTNLFCDKYYQDTVTTGITILSDNTHFIEQDKYELSSKSGFIPNYLDSIFNVNKKGTR